ncbi:MobF family relaxase [Dactylosporangium sp. NPDC050688]|uniref:MobF family relaxase n=1 Tax=Dactylosporangium sp. NPDC050688 TaxID=3157217 RepID=UPI0033DB1917
MLSIAKIHPGPGVKYLLDQVATGKHDFRSAPNNSDAAYYGGEKAEGEAPGWWAGQAQELFGVGPFVEPKELELLIGEGRHPRSGQQLGQVWRQYPPMTDAHRSELVEQAWARLPKDATYEQIAKVWLDIWTAPERRPVSGYDVTVAPVKSVQLLLAFGDARVRAQAMAAHHSAVRATIAHLRRHAAFTRLSGGTVQADTDGIAAAVFDHRMSREGDPQLHSHIVISAKVCVTNADGSVQWLALDGRALYQASISARVAYERALEVELGRRLGVRFAARAGSTIREIAGISARSIEQYSKRRTAVESALAGHGPDHPGDGRVLSMRRWRRAAQTATLATRPIKDGTESTADAMRRWRREDRHAGLDTARDIRRLIARPGRDDVGLLAVRALRRARRLAADPRQISEGDVVAVLAQFGVTDDEQVVAVRDEAVRRDPQLAVVRAVADVTADRAVFGVDHLELALGRILHVDPAAGAGQDWQRVRRLVVQAVNTGAGGLRILTPPALVQYGPTLRRASDRQPIYTRHRSLRLTTRDVLDVEQRVIAYAAHTGATAAPKALLDQVAADLDLLDEKRDALRFVLGDTRRVVGIVGPAGSGKTFLQRAVGEVANRIGHPIIGLTVGQNAAEVLAAATRKDGAMGIRTENIAMWLHAQSHLPKGSTPEQWRFRPGQWVIVDEASQVSSRDLANLVQLLDAVGGKLILVGDPAQVSAIGPGGLFRYLAGLGYTTELREVRRFAEAWERAASLRLRDGDTTVLSEYERRNRIRIGTRENLTEQLLDGWAADTLNGLQSLMLVETEQQAAELAAQARAILIRAGVVQRGRSAQLANGTRASIGDTIWTRSNDRRLVADTTLPGGKWVANRDTWKVLDVGPGGELHVRNTLSDAEVTLPAGYVAEHVQLAYAATVDSAQGRTVDTARALVDEAVTRAKLYVMWTRGALLNVVHVITNVERPEPLPPEPPVSGVAALADILRSDDTDRSATETELTLLAEHDALHGLGPIFDDLAGRANAVRYIAVLAAAVGPGHAARLAVDPAMPALANRLAALEDAGYDTDRVLTAVARSRELGTAESVAQVLAWRIDWQYQRFVPDPRRVVSTAYRTYTERIPRIAGVHADIVDALEQVAQIADQRVTGLAELAADHRPAWAAALGDIPDHDDPAGRRTWLANAGVVIAYRDRYQHRGDDPIGPEPGHRDVARWTAWHRASHVLGVATLAGQLRAANIVELRHHVQSQLAADATEPPYVAGKLRVAHLDLVDAEDTVRGLRTDLAVAEHALTRATRQTTPPAPRWWQIGALRAFAATRQPAAPVDIAATRQQVTDLRQQLGTATADLQQQRTAVRDLEGEHGTWRAWYDDNLPVRYAGLAAAAENARRANTTFLRITEVRDRIHAKTAKVRAVDDTRPKPHNRPVPDRLEDLAAASRDRLKQTTDDLGHTETPSESEHDLGL